jgi:ParE-like toxin of type II ParDE toxin-antitoxin system
VTVAAVEVSDEAKADLVELYKEDPELVREAFRQMQALEEQPYAGEKLREKSNRKPLAEADCRKLKFDRPDRSPRSNPRYRYRIVYRIEPHEGAPHRVYVIAVCPKQDAYGTGTARAAKRLRELARGRTARRQRRL